MLYKKGNIISRQVLIIYSFIISITGVFAEQKPSNNLQDTVIVSSLIQKAKESINASSFDSAMIYSREAINISEKIGYTKGIAFGYHRISQAFDFSGSSDSAIKYGKLSQKYSLLIRDSIGLARCFYTFGNIYLYKSWYSEALKYYLEAFKIYYHAKDSMRMNDCYGGIGIVYYYTKEWQKSILYLKLTADFERRTNDEVGLPETYTDLGNAYYELGKKDSAVLYFKLAEKIAVKTKNNRSLTAIYNNLGKIATDENNFNLAIEYIVKSIKIKTDLKFNEGLGENYINLGSIYKKIGNYQKTLYFIQKGLEYCKQLNAKEDMVLGYRSLSELYEKTGDVSKALKAYKMFVEVNDSVLIKKYNNQVAQWQTLYELKNQEFKLTEAKSELVNQQNTIQKNRIFQQFILAIVGIVILILILIIRNIHHKRIIARKENELNKHKIRELENEKLLSATQSVLKGEETERKRLARDLHDGLGGLLSGVKIALNDMKDNVFLTGESVNSFNQALGMLDNSIAELRRVAHNMMPEALMRLGLKDALNDFCGELGKVNPMQIIFQFYGQFERVDSNLEINIYRIIQELVNNALKYSEAKELVVQMIQEPKRLCFIVLDNGRGFEIKEIHQINGIGLANIKSRVDTFNGQLEISSKPGKGTEITIEFSI